MSRHGESPAREQQHGLNDNSSQFYVYAADSSGLERTYTVFGEVFRGMEVADKIVAAPCDDCNNPLELITMTLTVKD